jgi:transcriptional regulator with XRE-family HTH domain
MQDDMQEIFIHLGSVIQEARSAKGVSQKELAEKVDASLRTILDTENGHRNITYSILYKLLNLLQIPADLIFRPAELQHTAEQEQFIREFLDASDQEQRIAMNATRSIFRTLRE